MAPSGSWRRLPRPRKIKIPHATYCHPGFDRLDWPEHSQRGRSFPDRFEIIALAAGSNVQAAFEQAVRWKPRVISVAREVDADTLRKKLRAQGCGEIEVVYGSAGTVRVSTHPEADFVVSAIVGVAGLEATYEAVKAGKTVGLANKECLVAAGELITAEARKQGKPLLPIDSEHNAVHQCMRGGRLEEVQKIWLTAS